MARRTTGPQHPPTRAAHDPIGHFLVWFAEAQAAGLELPEAMVLATAEPNGRPAARYVLLKQADPRGFVFYTNARSRKGTQLAANPYAALVFYWHPLGRQVRVEGRVEPLTDAEADEYWATRPRESQLAALASNQSAPLADRDHLVSRWEGLRHRYAHRSVPRPPHWHGFRVVPDRIEFWTQYDHRLHHREVFTHSRRGWTKRLLQP